MNYNGTLVLAVTVSGQVELGKESGSLIRTIGNGDAAGAKFFGNDKMILTNRGKTEVRNESGELIRTIED